MNASDLIDILEKHEGYDRNKIKVYHPSHSTSCNNTELIVCPIENTAFADVFILTDNHQSKWKKMKTIKQTLITEGQSDLKIMRVFVFTTQLDDDDNGIGNDLIYRVGKNNSNELFLLKILDNTIFW